MTGLRLQENIAAAEITLDAGDLRQIESAISPVSVEGDRYSPYLVARVGK